MRFATALALLTAVEAFTVPILPVSLQQQLPIQQQRSISSTSLYSTETEEDKKTEPTSASGGADEKAAEDVEGLPWWWELVWELDMMKTGNPGEEITFGDSANVLRTNIEQIYGGYDSLDGCPLAEGALDDIADGTMFIGLQRYYDNYGSPYKLCFGPKSFLVISDPMQAKHILKDANSNYDKVRTLQRQRQRQ